MLVQEVKSKIENNTLDSSCLVFQYKDVPFVADQYINEIASNKGLSINYIESLDYLNNPLCDIFGESVMSRCINVFRVEEIESLPIELLHEIDLYVVVHKIKNKASKEALKDIVVEIPELEEWIIKDYVYSIAEGVPREQLDWLIEASNRDIYRLDNELDKLRLFTPSEQKYLFEELLYEGAFSDISSQTVFNLTNAVTARNLGVVRDCLEEIKSYDAEPLGVVTILYKSFRKLIQVWLAKNPTPESTLLTKSMIYAISKQPRVFTKDQLIKSFLLLTSIDRELKQGNIDTKWLIDYVICSILTF